jgi:carbon starvation protein
VGRYLLQDFLGNIWKPLGDTKNVMANLLSSGLIVAAWGYFLVQGVRDPLGGINSLWPLFGIANQLLAAIALCLATTVLLKMQLTPRENGDRRITKHPAIALVTIIPLAWLLVVTVDAGYQKIWSPNPKIGFLTLARNLEEQLPKLEAAVNAVKINGDEAAVRVAEKTLRDKRVLLFNQYLDATVAGIFLLLVCLLTVISVWEWYRLLSRKRVADLREDPPVWLPNYAITEAGTPANLLGVASLFVALAREVSGQADVDRAMAQPAAVCCELHQEQGQQHPNAQAQYVEHLDERYRSIRRCC